MSYFKDNGKPFQTHGLVEVKYNSERTFAEASRISRGPHKETQAFTPVVRLPSFFCSKFTIIEQTQWQGPIFPPKGTIQRRRHTLELSP